MRISSVALVFFFLVISSFGQGHKSTEAVAKMTVAEGFQAQLVASEPTIAQPVCIEFDDRGRLWVIQYLQYPNPAGLNRAKVDRFSRTTYDKVPEPPPHGPKGADRITILSDFDKNGRAQKAKDFIGGLNLASGLAFGHGGLFVLQVPYLLFYPDKNRDDVPDSDPEVLLTGFGMEDAHSVANSLLFGPDGWLYGCQGSTVTANIRGIEFQQGVWRYHPVSKQFELFCEGGGNSWGLDFDPDGELIYATNLGPYRNLHGVQGGYYWKSFGKHGALHNPYTYGYFDHIPYQNFVGGHVANGGIIYQGDSFPETFRSKYIANDLLGHTVQIHNMARAGSSFTASYGGELLKPNDTWFAPCDLTMGPDGAIYIADWHDKRTAHPDPDAEWDRSNGRIYRISFVGKGAATPLPSPEDLSKLSSEKLVELLGSKNNFLVRKARNILAERRDVSIHPKLRAQIFESDNTQLALESFWALYARGGAEESFLNDLLKHSSPQVRKWAVRFLGDTPQISPTSVQSLVTLAHFETNVQTRSQLASTAKRLGPRDGLELVVALLQSDQDVNDPHIPMLIWWALEKHCVTLVDDTVTRFTAMSSWRGKMTPEIILPRLMRRYSAEGTPATLNACGRLLEFAPGEKHRRQMLVSLEQGISEQRQENASTMATLPPTLGKELKSFWNDDSKDELVIQLLARLSFVPARERALALASSKESPPQLRASMLSLLAGSRDGKYVAPFIKLTASPTEPEAVVLAALEALRQFDTAEIPTSLLREYPRWKPNVRSKARDVLLGRKPWARLLLADVDSGKIAPSEFPLDQLQKVALLNNRELDNLVRKHWGNIGSGTPEEKLADIRRFNNDLRAFPGNARNGRELFMTACAACHELFGEGDKVGPELTHANRHDKDFLLTSIVDPSAVIRKEYLNFNIELSDGRVLNGLIVEQNGNSVTLAGAKNERTTINRDQIVSIQESTVSLMPEGLMHGLTPEERRDLFAYLQSEKPLASQQTK